MSISKALIVGGGSIGARHVRVSKRCGIPEVAVVEPDAARRDYLIHQECTTCFTDLEEGLSWQPDLTIVASPTAMHVEHAIAASQANCHLLIEKALSHNEERLTNLVEEIEKRGLVTLVGCNMRFHPGPSKVKELIEEGAIGKVRVARLHAGYYLPDWRPYRDYRSSYSARADLGGGCMLDCIHEIDLARWYLGEVEDVVCVNGRFSQLEISVEDVAALVCTHEGRALSEIHLDYLQRTFERGCHIIGETGTVFWDRTEELVKWFDGDAKCWKSFSYPPNWDTDTMYEEQLTHLLECIEQRKPTILPVREAVEVMKIVFAAKRSSQTGRVISRRSIVL